MCKPRWENVWLGQVCVFVCMGACGPWKAWMCDIRDHGYDMKEGVCVCMCVRSRVRRGAGLCV